MRKGVLLIFLLLFLSGCGTFTLYQNILETNFNLSSQNDIEMTAQIINSPFAMQLVEHRNTQSILVLSNVDNKSFSWVDSENNILRTFEGKIISSFGLINNIEIINSPSIAKIFTKLRNTSTTRISNSSLIRFSTPKTNYLNLDLTYTFHSKKPSLYYKKINKNPIMVWIMREDFFVQAINWKGANYYWISEDGKVVRSKQFIAPNLDKFFLETIKEYKY